MSAKPAPKPTKGKSILVQGEKVYANDHILVAAPWHLREGEPYMIARVMEFLPPASYSDPLATGTSREWDEDRVRVAYYLRQRDITTRYVADFKCILATMHSDVVPVSHVRIKCTVRHRDQIRDLERYKHTPNCFYWHQFYDRYLHRYFDAIPTDKVSNAPVEVVQHLTKNFDFVLCEVGTGSELTDASRGCVVCHKWAANNESVTCARCDRVFHLNCLDPPLPIKPRAGYSWSCAPCSKAHDDMVDNHLDPTLPSGGKRAAERPKQQTNGTGSRDKGKDRETSSEDAPMRLTNGWPFRYFGMHTDRYAVLDPHDSLYPRAKTRLGNRFQAVVGIWNEEKKCQESVEAPKPIIRRKEKPNKKDHGVALSSIQIARGDDKELTVIALPAKSIEGEQRYDSIVEQARQTPLYALAGVDVIDAALEELLKGNTPQETLERLRKLAPEDLGHATWSTDDQGRLIHGASNYGNDISTIAEDIENKTIYQVVKRYYMTIGAKIQDDVHLLVEEKASEPLVPKNVDTDPEAEENDSGRRPRRSRASAAAAIAAIAAATAGQVQDEAEEDEEKSECELDKSEKKQRMCATCDETKTTKWWRCPEGVGEMDRDADYPRVMCDSCSIRWRHYGTQYPPGPDELKMIAEAKVPVAVKKESVAKPRKGRDASNEDDYREKPTARPTSRAPLVSTTAANQKQAKTRSPSPPPVPAKPALTAKPCLLCKRMDPKSHLLQCRRCGLSAHVQCYGPKASMPADDDDDWFCDLCDLAIKRKPIAKHPKCVLCPAPSAEDASDKSDKKTLTALDCLKPTERLNYVHLLCGIWHQDLRFSDGRTYQFVEGINAIPARRFTLDCVICQQAGVGAVVKCQDCTKHFHVSCAWKANYKFAFEVFPVKKRQAKEVIVCSFRGESGNIVPCIWCPTHHFNQQTRKTYDLGQKDTATKLTALETYVQSVKTVHSADTFPLLRQARRVDKIVECALLPSAAPAAVVKGKGGGRGRRRSTSARALPAITEGDQGADEAVEERPAKRMKQEDGDVADRIAAIAPWLAKSMAVGATSDSS